ncbi:HEAT repeat domain-containing protein [bacterium]|nr:HEAT repeat domain-containing protein [bacterium]MCB2202228.1 HEAT repeat domain-containing protein [bacterium]
MNKTLVRPISESTLKTDLNDLAHALVRETAMAAKKVAIYGNAHPVAEKAIAKPFVYLSQVFHYRHFVTLNLQRGFLHLSNIRLKDSVFTAQLIQLMQMQEIQAILFRDTITQEDFAKFLDRLVHRTPSHNVNARIIELLRKDGVESIEVNSELSVQLFEEQKQYRGDVDGDFTIKRLALDQVGEDIRVLAELQTADSEALLKRGIDFYPEIIAYVIPEKIISMSANRLQQQLSRWADELKTTDCGDRDRQLSRFMSIIQVIERHPQRKEIVSDIDPETVKSITGATMNMDRSSATGRIKIESRTQLEIILETVFTTGSKRYGTAEFTDAFERLTRTGQQAAAIETLNYLIERMTDTDPDFRQRALDLATSAVDSLKSPTDDTVLGKAVDALVNRLATHRETYEFSELISSVFAKCMAQSRYDLTARLTGEMARRRQVVDGVTVYDSMAVKKGFGNINSPVVIRQLVDEIMRASNPRLEHVRGTMVAIGSEDIALALAEIIAHPLRSVRQQSLRILAELGKSSLRVFTRILVDDTWFEREQGRMELPDARWYVVRNSIFVLGNLNDPEGVVPLRLRISDSDPRVRREIVRSLEKIGGEEAIDLLALMAEDHIRTIAEAAVIAIGVIGDRDAAPILIDIVRRNPEVSIRTILALGKIGGPQARDWLTASLVDDDRLSQMVTGKTAKDDVRAAIVRALGSIGDNECIESLKKYQSSLSTAQRIFFKNSPVQQALSEVLARH